MGPGNLARTGYLEILFPANLQGDFTILMQGMTTYQQPNSGTSTPSTQDIYNNLVGSLRMCTNIGSGITALCDIPSGHDDRGRCLSVAQVAAATAYSHDFRLSSMTCA